MKFIKKHGMKLTAVLIWVLGIPASFGLCTWIEYGGTSKGFFTKFNYYYCLPKFLCYLFLFCVLGIIVYFLSKVMDNQKRILEKIEGQKDGSRSDTTIK